MEKSIIISKLINLEGNDIIKKYFNEVMPEIKYKINKYDSSFKLFCKEFVGKNKKNKESFKITIISLI